MNKGKQIKQNGAAKRGQSKKPKASQASAGLGMSQPQPIQSAPTAIGQVQKKKVAKINTSQNRRSTRIVASELVSSINGSTAFTANKFAVNPGVASTFPLLSLTAAQWEQYRFHKLKFRYVTRTGTTTVGSVILAPDYDPADPSPSSEARVTSYKDAVEGSAWQLLECVLDPLAMHELGPRKFIRDMVPAGDIKTFDVASFFLCTVEQADSSAIGKLWVDYDVELFVPQLSAQASPIPQSGTSFYVATGQTLTTAVEAAIDWTLVVNAAGESAGVFTPNKGVYMVEGNVSLLDSANELFNVTITAKKNSANLSPSITNRHSHAASGSNERINISIGPFYVFMNGTDTMEIDVTATGAAGTLTVTSGQLMITPV